MRGSTLIVVAALSLGASAAPASASAADAPACAHAGEQATALSIAQTRSAITCLLDAARADRHVDPLRSDVRLARAAQRFARALDPGKPLTHTGHGGSSPLDRIAAADYPRGGAFSAAETLGRSRGTLATPAARVESWLASASTRKLLMSARYRDVGIGVATAGGRTTFVVEVAARGESGAHVTAR